MLTSRLHRKTRRSAKHPLAGILRDRRGVSAVEFALIAPLMLTIFTGMAVVATGIMTKQHVSEATEGVGDILTEQTQLQTTDMANMFSAGGYIMQPYSSTPMSMRVTEIYYAPSTYSAGGMVAWSCATGTLSPYSYNQKFTTVPGTSGPISNVLWVNNASAAGMTFITVESSYAFNSPASWFLSGLTTMTSQFAVEPRTANYIGFPYTPGTTPTAPIATTKSNSVTLSNGAVCKYGS
jgi:Flp pilus assembly protein TadG